MRTSLAARFVSAPVDGMFESGPPDEGLLTRVARRDKRALEVLYDKYASPALGLAMRILGERAVAEEIVQEAFWRVWKRASTYDAGRGQFAAWLFGIVHNLAIDELRRRKAHPNAASIDLEDESVVDIPDVQVDVAEAAFQQVNGEQVRSALRALSESQRAVIELSYFEGLTHQEIADRLGEPLGTIHTRARLALQKLREELSPLLLDEL